MVVAATATASTTALRQLHRRLRLQLCRRRRYHQKRRPTNLHRRQPFILHLLPPLPLCRRRRLCLFR